MSGEYVTHRDLAKLLGVSETTVKSYRRKFPDCIPVANKGKPIRFTSKAPAVALRIRDLFSEGMSVPEVRTRLAAEFEWIEAKLPEAKVEKRVAPSAEVRGVANIARGVVDMNLRQDALLRRMENIESMLAEVGLGGAEEVDTLRRRREQNAERLEQRLDRLDRLTGDLGATVQDLASQLGRFLERRATAKENWDQERSQVVAECASVAASVGPSPERAEAKVVSIRPEAPVEPEPMEDGRLEPPRHFFSLPIVVRTPQGVYMSAGGRSRGRFSVNDLKAVLVYGFPSPRQYHISWESHGQGWRLLLNQPNVENSRDLSLLLMELPTREGGKVAEILQLKDGERQSHPAEFTAILESLLG